MTLQSNKKNQSVHCRPLRCLFKLSLAALLWPAFCYAAPEGAEVIGGQVIMNNATPGVTTFTNGPNATIHWQNFNIAQNELSQFNQSTARPNLNVTQIIGAESFYTAATMPDLTGMLSDRQYSGSATLESSLEGRLSTFAFGVGSLGAIPSTTTHLAESIIIVSPNSLIANLNLGYFNFLYDNILFIAASGSAPSLNGGINRAENDNAIIVIDPQIGSNGLIENNDGSLALAAGRQITLSNRYDPDIRFQIQAPADNAVNLGKPLTERGVADVFVNAIKHSDEINTDSIETDTQGHIRLVAQQEVTLDADAK